VSNGNEAHRPLLCHLSSLVSVTNAEAHTSTLCARAYSHRIGGGLRTRPVAATSFRRRLRALLNAQTRNDPKERPGNEFQKRKRKEKGDTRVCAAAAPTAAARYFGQCSLQGEGTKRVCVYVVGLKNDGCF